MIEFHNTQYARALFGGQIPSIVRSLEKASNSLEIMALAQAASVLEGNAYAEVQKKLQEKLGLEVKQMGVDD